MKVEARSKLDKSLRKKNKLRFQIIGKHSSEIAVTQNYSTF